MKMPAGKFRGKEMHEISSPYLKWVAENWDDDEVASAADEEWQHREHYNAHIYED